MSEWDDTPEARAALASVMPKMRETFSEVGAGDAYFVGREILEKDHPSLSCRQKTMIVCSAAHAIMGFIDDDDIHPYSEGGYNLFNFVSSCIVEKAWSIEKELHLDEDSIRSPEWEDPID